MEKRGPPCKENLGQALENLEKTCKSWGKTRKTIVAGKPKKDLGKIRKSEENLGETRKN